MKHSLENCGIPSFRFAGFAFPKYLWTLPHGSFAKRIARMRNPVTSGYYHAPKPNHHGGIGFYLGSDSPINLRWQWCDEVEGSRIGHTGWFTDDYQSETIRGLVMRLPGGRGFLAGWSMGENMASEIDSTLYETEKEAARAADREAEIAALMAAQLAEREAEKEREHQTEQQAERDIEEAKARIHAINKDALALIRELKTVNACASFPPAICAALRARLEAFTSERTEQFDLIKERQRNPYSAVEGY